MLARIIIFTGNMNDSVDNSLIYRNDEEGQLMKQIQGPLKIKIAQKRKIIIAIAVVTALLLVGTCYFAFSPAAPKEVLDQNKSLKQLNTQLKAKSAQLAQRLKQAKDLNVKLVDQNTSLTNQLQQNKGLIVYLQKDIELNCNPLKQRLRFNMTSMDAFTLSVSNTNKGALGGIPQITFLNMSGDSLKQFRDNSLPSLEYLDLTDNPIKTISNNKLDKIVDLVGTTAQPLLKEFSSNYMPMIKTLNLSHNNISAFRDNTISAVQALDISDNRLKSFSNFNLGALERLNISANPITEFNMNNFTNLVEFSCLFLVGPQGPSILFNDSYFGRVKSLQLSSIRISNSPVTLDFRNNYFPSLTNLTLKSFYTSYQSLKTNRMAELVDLAFFNCDFSDNIEYFAEWNSLLSLQYESCNVNKFSGHSYPKMVRLNLSQSHVETFSNNFLPLLQEFIISELYYAADLTFNNNTFSSLRALVFNVRTNSDMSWLKALRKLQYLQLGKYQIDNFNDFDMPQLQTLKLASDQVSSFKNNLFPSLKNLTISCSRLSFDATPYQDQLEGLQVKGSKITFENYSFPKLKYLNLQSQYLSTLAGNSFPVLEQLWILNVNFTLSELPALKRFFFLGSVLNFNLPHKYEGNLETLVIANTYMNSFDNYNMPQMKELRIIRGILDSFTLNKLPKATLIQLSRNHLTNFECGGLSAVQELGLGYNQLNDKIVDTLINCELSQLTTLDLENNQITDIEGARKRLSSAYPNAKIVL